MISDAERYLMRGRSQLRDTPQALKDLTIAGLREDVSRLLDDDEALRERNKALWLALLWAVRELDGIENDESDPMYGPHRVIVDGLLTGLPPCPACHGLKGGWGTDANGEAGWYRCYYCDATGRDPKARATVAEEGA